jgi:hypothetical protein
VAVAETHLVRGRPDREIVDLGEEVGAGFIVMGSRALGGVRRALMGRVSDPSSGTLTAASWSSDTEVAWPSDRGIRLRLAKCWSPFAKITTNFPHAVPTRTPGADTTSDTTQGSTPRNSGQPRATKIGLSEPLLQHRATPGNKSQRIVALRRSRVRAPSVTLSVSAQISRIPGSRRKLWQLRRSFLYHSYTTE